MPVTGNEEQGSVWVEQDFLYIIGGDGLKRRYSGALISAAPAAEPGSLWIENKNLCYVDAMNNKRSIPNSQMAAVPGEIGSLWMEGNFLHWVDSLGIEQDGHQNVAHIDATDPGYFDNSTYSDYADHGNTAHADATDPDLFDNTTYTDHANGMTGHDDYKDNYNDDGTGGVHYNCYDCASHANTTNHDNTTYSDYGDHQNTAHADYDNAGYFDNSTYSDYADHGNTAHVDSPVVV